MWNKFKDVLKIMVVVSLLIYIFGIFEAQTINFYFPKESIYLATIILLVWALNVESKKILAIEESKTKETESTEDIKGWKHIVLIVMTIIISMSFSIPRVGDFLAVDEHRWIDVDNINYPYPESYEEAMGDGTPYARSSVYWDAYLSGEFRGTFNNANPSATLSFLYLPAYLIEGHVSFNNFLFTAKLTIILHCLLMLIIAYFLFKRLFNRKTALLFFIIMALSPLFVGFSRIFNHDSIQGLYIMNFILALWLALNQTNKKYYIIAGIFYALALCTQFKSNFILALIFILPIAHAYIYKDKSSILHFGKNLVWLYIAMLLVTVIIIPAVFHYPTVLYRRFFIYPKLAIIIAISLITYLIFFILCKSELQEKVFSLIRDKEKTIIRTIIICIGAIFLLAIYKHEYVFNKVFYMSLTHTYYQAFLGTIVVLFYSIPTIVLAILVYTLFYYLRKPKINFCTIFLTLFFIFMIFATFISFKVHPKYGTGYNWMDWKYIYLFYPILISALLSNRFLNRLSEKKIYILSIITIISLVYANYSIKPYYIHYNNFLLPDGNLITHTTWALDTAETAEFINENFKDARIYSPGGQLEYFTKENIYIIPWFEKFWKENPDYIIIEWEKTNKFNYILDYYRENFEPIWAIEKNGVVYTGIYRFEPTVPYAELYNTNPE